MDLITIVIPVYNGASFLPFSVSSVIAQTYPNIELLIIDDGSSDESVEVAERLIKDVSFPARVVRHEKNLGLSASRNTGIREAAGAWINFLDCDDCISPCKLEKQGRAAATVDEKIGAIYCGYQTFKMVDGKVELLGDPIYSNIDSVPPVAHLLAETYIHVNDFIFRTAACKAVDGFNTSFRLFEDDEFKVKIALAGYGFQQVPSDVPTYLWRLYPDQPRWGGSKARYKVREVAENYLYCLRLALRNESPHRAGLSPEIIAGIAFVTTAYAHALCVHSWSDGRDYAKRLAEFYPEFRPTGPKYVRALSNVVGFKFAQDIATVLRTSRRSLRKKAVAA